MLHRRVRAARFEAPAKNAFEAGGVGGVARIANAPPAGSLLLNIEAIAREPSEGVESFSDSHPTRSFEHRGWSMSGLEAMDALTLSHASRTRPRFG